MFPTVACAFCLTQHNLTKERVHSSLNIQHWGKLEQDLKQKPWRGSACWLRCGLMLSQAFIYSPGHLPRDGATHTVGCALPPASITNQDSISQMCLQANPVEAILHLKLPFQVTQVGTMLMTKTKQDTHRSSEAQARQM